MSDIKSKSKINRRLALTLSSFAALALSTHTLHAQTTLYFEGSLATGTTQTGSWDATTTSDWNTASDGSGTLTTFGTGNNADFSITGVTTATVTLGSAVTANGITFSDGATGILGAFAVSVGAGGITVNSGATGAIGNASANSSVAATAAQTWANNGTGTLIIGNAAINNAVTLSAGNIQLGTSGGNNTFSAGANGLLIVNGANVAEDFSSGNYGGTVVLVSGDFGTGTSKGTGGALTMVGSSITFNSTKGGGATISGGVTLGSATLYGSQTSATNVSGYNPVFNVTSTAGNTFSGALIGSATGQTLTVTAATGAIAGLSFGAGANSPAVIANGAGTTNLNSSAAAGGTTLQNASGVFNITANSTIPTTGTTAGTITASPGGTGTLTINSGRVESSGAATAAAFTVANNVVLGGNVSFGAATATASANNGALIFSGAALTTPTTFTLTTTPTLTVINTASTTSNSTAAVTINSVIGQSGGTFGITKAGGGMLALGGADTYAGATSVTAGTLVLSTTGSINSSPTVSLTGLGTLTLNNATALSNTGTLSLVTGTTLNLNAAAGTTETIGNLVLDGTTEPAQTYTAAQLATLDSGIAFASANGETLTVTAVPEPSTWVEVFLGMGIAGFALNKRRGAARVNGRTV